MSVGRFVRARIVWKVLSLCKCSGKMFRWCVRWSAEASNAHKCAISSQLVSEFEFKMQMMLMMRMNKWWPRHDINCAKNKQQNGQERGQIGTSYSRPRSVESCLSPLTLRPAHPLLLRFTNEGCILTSGRLMWSWWRGLVATQTRGVEGSRVLTVRCLVGALYTFLSMSHRSVSRSRS
jgi:hypothetical protein